MYDRPVSIWKKFSNFTVELGETIIFRCDAMTYASETHIIPVWKNVGGEWKQIKNLEVPSHSEHPINSKRLGVGEFCYRNANGEDIVFTVR